MIPKEKMALLIAGIKPKKDASGIEDDDEEKDEAPEEEAGYSFADCMWKMMMAFKSHDREAFDDHAADMQDILRKDDKDEEG